MALTRALEALIFERHVKAEPVSDIADDVGVTVTAAAAAIARTSARLGAPEQAERTMAMAEYDLLRRIAWERLEAVEPASDAAAIYLQALLEIRRRQDALLAVPCPAST